MDDDAIQLGEVQHAAPQPELRPDQNRHYAVLAVGEPAERDLSVFVDLDALRDMEEHAFSDTGVELGGVLLGSQCIDDQGRPFVVVEDSLRAQHYESTKGSFKFTHETWSQITRERGEFPAGMQMVGWYHTHPGWGVFLSGMDLFICEHFFNRPLDVALVIDPCGGDRAFFQWDGRSQTRPTGGFYLMASRHRQDELEDFAATLQKGSSMPSQTVESRRAAGAGPAPVVNIITPQQTHLITALAAMLCAQFGLLALIAWGMLRDSGAREADARVAALEEQIAQLTKIDAASKRLSVQQEVLDHALSRLGAGADKVTQSLTEERLRREGLEAAVLGQDAIRKSLQKKTEDLTADLTEQDRKLTARIETLQGENKRLQERNELHRERITKLNERLRELSPSEGIDEGESNSAEPLLPGPLWAWIAGGTAVAVAGGMAGLWAWQKRREDVFRDAEEG